MLFHVKQITIMFRNKELDYSTNNLRRIGKQNCILMVRLLPEIKMRWNENGLEMKMGWNENEE